MKRTRLPRRDEFTLKTAHDVRRMAPCKGCGGLGDDRRMLNYRGAQYHGACLVKLIDRRTLAKLPEAEFGKLTLGDLPGTLAGWLLDKRKRLAKL